MRKNLIQFLILILLCGLFGLLASCEENTDPEQQEVNYEALLDCTEDCLKLFFKTFDGIHYTIRNHNREYGGLVLPSWVSYARGTKEFEYRINLSGILLDDFIVDGVITAAASPNDPTKTVIDDGFQHKDVAQFRWNATHFSSPFDTVGMGAFAVNMLSHESYWCTLIETTFFNNSNCVFSLNSLGYGWNIKDAFEDASHFEHIYEGDEVVDSIFVFPYGSLEFGIISGSDVLSGLLTFSESATIADFEGELNLTNKKFKLDLLTFEISE